MRGEESKFVMTAPMLRRYWNEFRPQERVTWHMPRLFGRFRWPVDLGSTGMLGA